MENMNLTILMYLLTLHPLQSHIIPNAMSCNCFQLRAKWNGCSVNPPQEI